MKLYYMAGACSLASLISLIEGGQKFEAIALDRATRKTADGKDFASINPKGYVPALVLDNGEVLTENAALLAYIGDLNPAAKLIPASGLERFRVQEWLAYINSEVHKTVSPLFNPATPDAAKQAAKEYLAKRLSLIEQRLGSNDFLTGAAFTVADAYLYVVLSWRSKVGVNIDKFPKLAAFYDRVKARPSVKAARQAEGLE